MKVGKTLFAVVSGCALLGLAPVGHAAGSLDQLNGLIGGGPAGPAIGSFSSSNFANVAGVLQYCAKNNYLKGGTAGSVKDKMLAKLHAENTSKTAQPVNQSPEYLNGVRGMLTASDGRQVDLGKPGIKDTITQRVCETVLSQGKLFL